MPNNIFGTPSRDILAGDTNSADLIDYIYGYAGNDTLTGKIANDRIDGGDGFDEIAGSEGDDFLLGGNGSDNIGNIRREFIADSGNNYFYEEFEPGNDVIYGDDGSSSLLDTFDYISGGAGNDRIYGGAGNDTIGEINYVFQGDGYTDAFYGYEAGNDRLYGQAGNDFLYGGAGSDQLFGGGGKDYVDGYFVSYVDILRDREQDVLTGGAGADRFILGREGLGVYYNSAGQSSNVSGSVRARDRAIIKDFDIAAGDRIQLLGKASDYTIGASPLSNIPGTGIFLGSGATKDLIAVVQGTSFGNFSSGFIFV